MRLATWQQDHKLVIHDFLTAMNRKTDAFILKGGTALMECYHLDRFSEAIDLDATHGTLHEFVEDFCKERGYAFRIAKDTQTVNRFMIAYDQENNKPLKVEISYRNKNISPNLYQEVDGIQVYTIDRLAQLKAGAYQGREKIRDLYDICFICNKHYYELGEATINQIKDAVLYKGFDYLDYIVETQPDPLIDKDKLADSYLRMFDKLDLLYTHEEKSELLANRRKPLTR